MKTVIEVNVVCTIEDPGELMEIARAEVDKFKPLDDRSLYYAPSAEDALQQIIRTAIAERLLPLECVSLHEISHKVKSLDSSF